MSKAPLSDEQIRRRILEALLKQHKENPNESSTLTELISEIGKQELDPHVVYLAGKKLIDITRKVANHGWLCVRINSCGIDYLEKLSKNNGTTSSNNLLMNNYINYGILNQASNGSQINCGNQQVSDCFKTIYKMIEEKTDITVIEKEEIRQNMVLLEEETKKSNPDASKIKRFSDWFKQNAPWLVPTITPIIADVVNRIFSL